MEENRDEETLDQILSLSYFPFSMSQLNSMLNLELKNKLFGQFAWDSQNVDDAEQKVRKISHYLLIEPGKLNDRKYDRHISC